MDSSRYPTGESSLFPPPRPATTNRLIIPANLNISSFLFFGKQPLKTSSPVKRKPLPPNSPAFIKNRNGASANGQKTSSSSAVIGSGASSPFVRDLDQYVIVRLPPIATHQSDIAIDSLADTPPYSPLASHLRGRSTVEERINHQKTLPHRNRSISAISGFGVNLLSRSRDFRSKKAQGEVQEQWLRSQNRARHPSK